jgi:hypothetical protein
MARAPRSAVEPTRSCGGQQRAACQAASPAKRKRAEISSSTSRRRRRRAPSAIYQRMPAIRICALRPHLAFHTPRIGRRAEALRSL